MEHVSCKLWCAIVGLGSKEKNVNTPQINSKVFLIVLVIILIL